MSVAAGLLAVATFGIGAVLAGRAFLLTRRAGAGPVDGARLAWSALGVVSIVVVVVGPVHDWTEYSLAGHMTQHVVLLLAPLALVVGRAGTGMLVGLPPRARTAVSRWIRRSGVSRWARTATRRPVAWAILVLTVGFWHVPPIFDAAASSEALHALEHLSFLGVGACYWVSILGGSRRREQASALLSIFGVMLVGTAFGALLTFATAPWYPVHARLATAAGLDWLRDQQAAGLIMWIPPSVVMLALFLRVAASWLDGVERRSNRLEAAS